MRCTIVLPVLLLAAPLAPPGAADPDPFVAETHQASLKLREEALRRTIARDAAWPPGVWGDNHWTLSALYMQVKMDAANARLLRQANDYIESKPAPRPDLPGKRVFIGEYGFPASRHTPEEQDRRSRAVMRVGLPAVVEAP